MFVHVAVSSFPLSTLLCGFSSTQVDSKRHENLRDMNICIFLITEDGEMRSSYKQGFLVLGYTGCPRRSVPDFGRVFRMLKYTDITQNTYVQS